MAPGSETGGCLNCYAARLNARNLPELRSPITGKPFARIMESGPRWTGEVELIEKQLPLPLKWRKPKRIFVNSMSDLFHDALSDEQIDRVFAVMATAKWHTFQVLTKRPQRMRAYLRRLHGLWMGPWETEEDRAKWITFEDFTENTRFLYRTDFPLPNLWLGVSVENQKTADARIPLLLKTPAAIRFVSYEPALGPVRLFDDNEGVVEGCAVVKSGGVTPGTPHEAPEGYGDSFVGIDWLVMGGESGPGARPMHPDWVRSMRDQCKAWDIPFFFKQWGTLAPASQVADTTPIINAMTKSGIVTHFDRESMIAADPHETRWEGLRRVKKKGASAELDGETWRQFPAVRGGEVVGR